MVQLGNELAHKQTLPWIVGVLAPWLWPVGLWLKQEWALIAILMAQSVQHHLACVVRSWSRPVEFNVIGKFLCESPQFSGIGTIHSSATNVLAQSANSHRTFPVTEPRHQRRLRTEPPVRHVRDFQGRRLLSAEQMSKALQVQVIALPIQAFRRSGRSFVDAQPQQHVVAKAGEFVMEDTLFGANLNLLNFRKMLLDCKEESRING